MKTYLALVSAIFAAVGTAHLSLSVHLHKPNVGWVSVFCVTHQASQLGGLRHKQRA